MLIFVPVNLPCTHITDKYGLRVGLLIGWTLQTIGIAMKTFLNRSFWYATVGQTIMAVGQPFTLNAPSKLSASWFPEDQRNMATMIMVNANVFGALLGFALPRVFVNPSYDPAKTYTQDEIDTFKTQVMLMCFAQGCFCILLEILIIFTFKDHSEWIAEENNNRLTEDSLLNGEYLAKELTFMESMKLLKGKNYWLATISSSITIALFYCIATIVG